MIATACPQSVGYPEWVINGLPHLAAQGRLPARTLTFRRFRQKTVTGHKRLITRSPHQGACAE